MVGNTNDDVASTDPNDPSYWFDKEGKWRPGKLEEYNKQVAASGNHHFGEITSGSEGREWRSTSSSGNNKSTRKGRA